MRARAKGWLRAEAAAGLLISRRAWLGREDFLRLTVRVWRGPFCSRQVAMVDFAAEAVRGTLACSAGERQMLLAAASIGEGIPAGLREAALGLDAVNAARVAVAVRHAAGHRVMVVAGTRP